MGLPRVATALLPVATGCAEIGSLPSLSSSPAVLVPAGDAVSKGAGRSVGRYRSGMTNHALLARIEKLEKSQHRWRIATVAAIALGACGGITSHYEKCFSQSFMVERGSNGGDVLAKLAESPSGGRLEILDGQGKTRVVIDSEGVRTLDAAGKERWASPK